jgi:hypothetical protein
VESLMSICAYCRIDLPKAKSILRSANQTVGRWRERGQEIGMTEFELNQFSDAFHHQQAASARRITGVISATERGPIARRLAVAKEIVELP